MRYCYIKLPVHITVQKRKKKHPFLCVHIYLLDNKDGAKDVHFCVFKLIKCVFKNLRFSGYPLFDSVFKNLRVCADQCEHFHKIGGFSLCFCTKTEQCKRGLTYRGQEECNLINVGYQYIPSTLGEKMMRFLYKYSPYFCNNKPGSSAVLKVKSKPFSVDVRNTKQLFIVWNLCAEHRLVMGFYQG